MHIKCVFGHTKHVVSVFVSVLFSLSSKSYGGSQIMVLEMTSSSIRESLIVKFVETLRMKTRTYRIPS